MSFSLPDSLKRFSLRIIHHHLPKGKMIFKSPQPCTYCKLSFTSSFPHGHFLTCSSSSSIKNPHLSSINNSLSWMHTPPLLQQHILLSLSKLYNIYLYPSKHSLSSSIYNTSEVYQYIKPQKWYWVYSLHSKPYLKFLRPHHPKLLPFK